jgi:predicted nicotinamide N-methyase
LPITVPAARDDPRLCHYELRRLRVPIGAGSLSIVVPDARAVRRGGEWTDAALRGGEPPYWSRIWPAAVAAARASWRRGALAGARVLDLGCGLGLPGLAAASAGADVTFADRQPDALAFATWNARRLAPERVRAVELDWANAVVPGTFDVLVLADVSYRAVHHAALQRHVEACLAPGGVVLHAEPCRPEAAPFLQWLRQRGPVVEATHPTAFDGVRTDVRVVVAGAGEAALAPWRTSLAAGHGPQRTRAGAGA